MLSDRLNRHLEEKLGPITAVKAQIAKYHSTPALTALNTHVKRSLSAFLASLATASHKMERINSYTSSLLSNVMPKYGDILNGLVNEASAKRKATTAASQPAAYKPASIPVAVKKLINQEKRVFSTPNRSLTATLRNFVNTPSSLNLMVNNTSGQLIPELQKAISAIRPDLRRFIKESGKYIVMTFTFSGRDVDNLPYLVHRSFYLNNRHIDLTQIQREDGVTYRLVGSDLQQLGLMLKFVRFEKYISAPSKNRARSGAFFAYKNTSNIDMSIIQIYADVKAENYLENCFIYALRMAGVPEATLTAIKVLLVTDTISTKDIGIIAERYNLYFCITNIIDDDLHKTKLKYIGDKSNTRIDLINYRDHYIYNFQTNIRSRNVNNGRAYTMEPGSELWVISVLRLVVDNFIPITEADTEIYKTPYIDRLVTDEGSLTAVPEDFKLIHEDRPDSDFSYLTDPNFTTKRLEELAKPITPVVRREYVFADFETVTSDRVHYPYQVAFHANAVGSTVVIDGYDCADRMLKMLPSGSVIIFHNLSYDIAQIFTYTTVKILSVIRDGTRTKSATFTYKGKYFEARDSLNYINQKLADFPKMFGLGDIGEKEILPYGYYTKEHIDARYCPIDDYVNAVAEDKRGALRKLITPYISGDNVDIIAYSGYYCKRDVDILKGGYEIFAAQMKTMFDIDINDTLTLASAVYKAFVANGCLDGIYQVSNQVQRFILRSCVGGRCCTQNNKKINYKGDVLDYDGVSLYPSAMAIAKPVKGKAKVIPSEIVESQNLEWLNAKDDYFIEIDQLVTEGLNYDLGIIPSRGETSINWVNSVSPSERFVYNKTGLNLLTNKLKCTFRIIRGYYYDEGFNTRMNHYITFLFNVRAILKKQKNKLQETIKLFLNSSYGKLLQRPIETSIKVFNREDANTYISNNFDRCIEEFNVGANVCVKVANVVNTHFNACHIASEILAKSKQIVYNVTCIPEVQGMLLYTDTDSIQCKAEALDIIRRQYKTIYNVEITGTQLGQFHSDYEDINGLPATGKQFIAIGKKQYAVRCENELGDVKYHIRSKGVGPDLIESRYANPMDFYERLYNGESELFVISDMRPVFRLTNTFTMTNAKLERTIKSQY